MGSFLRTIGVVLLLLAAACLVGVYMDVKEKHQKTQRAWTQLTGQKGEPFSYKQLIAFDKMSDGTKALFLGGVILGAPGLVCLVLPRRRKNQAPA